MYESYFGLYILRRYDFIYFLANINAVQYFFFVILHCPYWIDGADFHENKKYIIK